MFRTWDVRLPARKFTESVRSFQYPDPGHLGLREFSFNLPPRQATLSSPRRRTRGPSVTMMLIVLLSSSTSPLALAMIFCEGRR